MVMCFTCGDLTPEPEATPSHTLASYIKDLGEETGRKYNAEEFTDLVRQVTTYDDINAEVDVGAYWTTLLGLVIHARLSRSKYWENEMYEEMAQGLLDAGADMHGEDEHGHAFIEDLKYLPRMALLFGSRGLKTQSVILAQEFEQSRIWLFKKQYKGWEALERVKDETIKSLRAELETSQRKLKQLDQEAESLTRNLRQSEISLQDVVLSEKNVRCHADERIANLEQKQIEIKNRYELELNEVLQKTEIQTNELATYTQKSRDTQWLLESAQRALSSLQEEHTRLKGDYLAKMKTESALRDQLSMQAAAQPAPGATDAPGASSATESPARPSAPKSLDGAVFEELRLSSSSIGDSMSERVSTDGMAAVEKLQQVLSAPSTSDASPPTQHGQSIAMPSPPPPIVRQDTDVQSKHIRPPMEEHAPIVAPLQRVDTDACISPPASATSSPLAPSSPASGPSVPDDE